MSRCWNKTPTARPTMRDVKREVGLYVFLTVDRFTNVQIYFIQLWAEICLKIDSSSITSSPSIAEDDDSESSDMDLDVILCFTLCHQMYVFV